MKCQIYEAIKKVKDNEDQRCADMITNVINQGSKAASSPSPMAMEHINKAKVITEFLISNGKKFSYSGPSLVTNNSNLGGPAGWTEERHEDGTVVYTNPAANSSKAASVPFAERENKALVIANFLRTGRV